MAIKFDKEMLLKQRFWVMLGVSVCLSLTGIFYLQLMVDAEDIVKGIRTSLDKAKTLKGPFYNEKAIKLRTDDAERAQKSEAKVWKEAYLKQELAFKWGKEIEDNFEFANGRFATEIKMAKGANPKDWPADTPTLIHGTLADQAPTFFKLKTRKGEVLTFYRTFGVNSVGVTDLPKPIVYPDMLANSKDRYLAVKYQTGRYFQEMLMDPELKAFADSYKPQIHPILRLVDPYDDKGNGVVQLRNWLYTPDAYPVDDAGASLPFFRFVTTDWKVNKDFSKEAWIAQENLWILKEIYTIIKKTNESISNFQRKDGKGEKMIGKEAEVRDKPFVFTNSYFEAELVLHKDDSLSFKIKNRLERRQRLDLKFTVQLNNQPGMEPEVIPISGLPLMPQGDKGGKDFHLKTVAPPAKGAPRRGIYSVKQVLTWETAAVKRIDQISIGSNGGADEISHSQRTYFENLRPFDVADIGAPDFGNAAPPGVPAIKKPVVAPGKNPKAQMRVIGAGLGNNVGNLEHGLWRDRYVEVTEQSRRIPVAVSLIIDQDHVDRVLTAFNNSRLRFLETQVLLNQYAGSLQPPAIEPREGAGAAPSPFKVPFGPRPGVKDPAAQPSTGGAQDAETNMEIVIYGIMTLYQRYPPRPTVAAAPTAVVPAPPAAKNER